MKNYKYYIAYCFIKDKAVGYGEITITNSKKIKLKTIEDIEDLKKWIIEKTPEKIENVAIMNIIELKGE